MTDVVDKKGSDSSRKLDNCSFQDWANEDNNAFYEEISPEGLLKLSLKAGLNTGCDVKQTQPYWKTATNILDVGAGFGRVIKALLDLEYRGKITAVERNDSMYEYINKKYGSLAKLIHADIFTIEELNDSFDAIFFMWSGLADFSLSEQPRIIKKLANLLSKKGVLIIDTMPTNVVPLDTENFAPQSFSTRANNHTVYTYEANKIEMESFAKASDLRIIDVLHCQTDSGRIRWLYLMQHISSL